MKKTLATTLVSFAVWPLLAQGLVNFFNNSTTLVTSGPPAQPVGSTLVPSYFGLLIAAPGTVDPALFTFSGLYATNQPSNGRFFGGTGVPVVGWVPGTSESFLIAGWSMTLGHDWNPAWMHGGFSAQGFWGLSTIATGIAGGYSALGTVPLPPLNLFGGVNGLQAGWNLGPVVPVLVPEPSSLPLAILGIAAVLMCRHGIKERRRSRTIA